MEWFTNILQITKGHILNFLNNANIRLGITGATGATGAKYGALPQTKIEEVRSITEATRAAQVARFASYDTKPSYVRLYEDTYTYYSSSEHKKNDSGDDSGNDSGDNNFFKRQKNKKNKKNNVKEYVKELDATQAAFIVIKENRSKYIVHLLFTRDTRINFLRGKIPTILLRVLYLEQFKYGNTVPLQYICIGTIDANNNRDHHQTAFHQDNFPSYFISDPLERVFNNTILTFFQERPHYPQGGFLDFQTIIPHVAITTGRDRTHELFRLLEGAAGRFAPFFAYLNSIITHATPDYIKIDDINTYYISIGQQVPPEVAEFVDKFNKYLAILHENERKFRRCLLSFAVYELLVQATQTIQQFKTNATATIEEDIITKNLDDYLLGSSIFAPNTNRQILFNNNQFLNDPDRDNIDKFVYMRKTFNLEDTSNNNQDNPNLNYLIELKNKMFLPIEGLLVDRDNNEAMLVTASDAGGSRSKTRQKRNTKKRYNKKGRRTNKKKHNRRRSKKRQ